MTTPTIAERLELTRLIRTGRAKQLRIDAGLTCVHVGVEIGANPTTVWNWEAGRRRPNDEDFVAYLTLLRWLDSELSQAS